MLSAKSPDLNVVQATTAERTIHEKSLSALGLMKKLPLGIT